LVAGLAGVPAAQEWLERLPALIHEVRDAWELTLSAPLAGGSCSWVAAATTPDGTRAVVKIGWPHREMLGEPVALRAWDGGAAVRLLGHDPDRHALLLERCEPGTPLSRAEAPAAARLRAAAGVLRDLWAVPAPATEGLESLGDVTAEWADGVEERMARLRPGYDPGLVCYGVELLRTLPGSAPRTVLLHGDFNPGNVLAARRRPWLAIDPKPMMGDPGYDPWPLFAQVDDPFRYRQPSLLSERVALLADELALDRDRVVAWMIARAVENALYDVNRGYPQDGAEGIRRARLLADL
jgi:streptomycin 6-kinase